MDEVVIPHATIKPNYPWIRAHTLLGNAQRVPSKYKTTLGREAG